MIIGSVIGGIALLGLAVLVWAAERSVAADRAELSALLDDAGAADAAPRRGREVDAIAA